MLVVSRKEHQEVFIDVPPSSETRRIVVSVPEIRGDKVRLGFDADRDIIVDRSEVAEAKAGVQS
jgi:carbon storage regulator